MSMARGFLFAGCKSVVASPWRSEEVATKELLQYFYQAIQQGKTKAESLRLARQQYLANSRGLQWKHPHFWSGFSIIGNAEPIQLSTTAWTWWLLGGICILLLLFLALKR